MVFLSVTLTHPDISVVVRWVSVNKRSTIIDCVRSMTWHATAAT